jgi:protease YdgD
LKAAAAFALVSLLATSGAPAAADPRVAVGPNEPPWNAIAKVQTNTAIRCTGVLIAPAVVLTAAHCLYNRLTGRLLQPVSLHVLFGYERAGYRWHRLVRQVTVGDGFDGAKRQPQAADWARLDLAEPVPAAPLPLYGGTVAVEMPVALAGYNQDRAQLLMADTACRVRRAQAAFVTHDCAATYGTSGAPLVTRQGDGWAVVGINIAAGRELNLALRPGFSR